MPQWPCAARSVRRRADSAPRPHRGERGCHTGKTDRCFSNKSLTVVVPDSRIYTVNTSSINMDVSLL